MKKVVIFCFYAMLLISCSYQQLDKVSPLKNWVNIGDKFRITLPENHSTGYMWQINNNFDNGVLDYYGSVFRGNEKGVDFNFCALKKGNTIINFALIKYKDTTEVKQFIIEVK